jgi:hypothetical protein
LSAPRRGRLTPGKDPVPIVQEAGWAPGRVWTCAKNLAPTGIRSSDLPARSQSLYRLSYRVHTSGGTGQKKNQIFGPEGVLMRDFIGISASTLPNVCAMRTRTLACGVVCTNHCCKFRLNISNQRSDCTSATRCHYHLIINITQLLEKKI